MECCFDGAVTALSQPVSYNRLRDPSASSVTVNPLFVFHFEAST
jgi:hypothetical protein